MDNALFKRLCLYIGIFLFALPLIGGGLSFWPRILDNFRLISIPALGCLFIGLRPFSVSSLSDMSRRGEKKIFFGIMLFYALVFLKVTFLNYYTFHVSGIDFSVLDQMIPYTALGKFMFHPVMECNHFGIHSTPIYFLLYPFHRFFNHPFFFLILHPLMLWLGAFPLWMLLKHHLSSSLHRLLLLFAYFNFYMLAQVLRYHFHFEVFYIPFFLFLFYFYEIKASWRTFLMVVLILSIKEDAALYLCTFFGATLFFPVTMMEEGEKRKLGFPFTMILISFIFFIINLKVIIPQNRTIDVRIEGLISKYGATYFDIFMTMITHPLLIFQDIFTGGWLKILIPTLLLPLFDLLFLIAVSPIILITATASFNELRMMAIHYSSPYLPFVFYALIRAVSDSTPSLHNYFRLPSLFLWVKEQRKFIIPIITALCFYFGGGYIQFEKFNPSQYQAFQNIKKEMDLSQGPCQIQLPLVPHFNYDNLENIKFLTPASMKKEKKDQTYCYLFNTELKRYPFPENDLYSVIEELKNDPSFELIQNGSFLLFKRAMK